MTPRRLWKPAVSAAVFVFLAAKGPLPVPDSQSYLDAAITRAPGYPALLMLFHAVFGGWQLPAVCAFQLAVCVCGARFFAAALEQPAAIEAVIQILALAPLFKLPTGGEPFFANMIASDGISYGLWLFLAGMGARLLRAPSARGLAGFGAVYAALMLARPQFLFMVPVIMLACALLAAYRRISWRAVWLALPALAVFLAATGFAERTWHYAVNGRFVKSQALGTQLIPPALYLAKAEDAALFSGPEAGLFSEAFAKAEANGWTAPRRRAANLMMAAHYTSVYDNLRASFCAGVGGNGADCASAAGPVARKLLLAHRLEYVKLIAAQCLSYWPYYHAWAVAVVIALCFLSFRGRPGAVYFIFAVLADVLNLATVCAAATAGPRYMIHTEIVLAAALLVFLSGAYMINSGYDRNRDT
ncbi:MAG: hypothetical protein WC421_03135 [Elusimicrobiales bacterium]